MARLVLLLLAAVALAGCETQDIVNPADPVWVPQRGFVNDWSEETRDARRR
jgi:hypothetical protein